MTVTRKELADTISAIDVEMARLQETKREAYQDYREQLSQTMGKDAAKAEVDAFKLALKRMHAIAQHGMAAIEEKDALVAEILGEISGTRIAAHVARGAREPVAKMPDVIDEATGAGPGPWMKEGATSIGALDPNSPVKVAGGVSAAAADPDRPVVTEQTTPPSEGVGTAPPPADQYGRGSEHDGKATILLAGHVVPANAPVPVTDGSRIASRSGPIRPYCLKPGCCGSPGGRVHCYSCETAHKESDLARAHQDPDGPVFTESEGRGHPMAKADPAKREDHAGPFGVLLEARRKTSFRLSKQERPVILDRTLHWIQRPPPFAVAMHVGPGGPADQGALSRTAGAVCTAAFRQFCSPKRERTGHMVVSDVDGWKNGTPVPTWPPQLIASGSMVRGIP